MRHRFPFGGLALVLVLASCTDAESDFADEATDAEEDTLGGEPIAELGAAEDPAAAPPKGQDEDEVVDGLPVVASWDFAAWSGQSGSTLTAIVSNTADHAIKAEAWLGILGHAGQLKEQPIATLDLAAKSSKTIAVDLATAGIYPDGPGVALQVRLHLEGDVVSPSEPAIVQLAIGGKFTVRTPQEATVAFDPQLTAEQFEQALSGHGGTPPHDGSVQSGTLETAADWEPRLQFWSEQDKPQHAPPDPQGVAVCTYWPAEFYDSHRGEDVLNFPGLQWVDASFASAYLMDEIGTIRWSGNLDYAGCTPRLKLPLGEYWLMQTPRMQVDGISAVVAPRIADVPAPPTYATRFVIEETPSTVLVEPAMENAITRVAAILTYALQFRQYFELPSVSFVAFAQESSVGAAFDGPYMHFGLTSNTGTSVTRSKFLIGHELGHYVQAYTISIPPSSYGPDPNAMCGCSHVMTSSSTHCLQSREYIGAARKEGFAHFFATHMFNWHWEEDCRFAYYKEWMDASGIVHAPPVDIDCDVPVRWMQSYCPGPDAGVEHDWLGFFWALLDDPDTHAGIAELHGIFDACTTFECPWTDLRAGATALYGSGSIGLARFEAIGAEFGVTSP